MATNNDLTPKQIILTVVAILGIPFLITLFSVVNSNNSNNTSSSSTISTIDNSKFEILESTSTISEDGTYTIKGKVKQKDDSSFTGLGITFIMYDKDNNKVRETTGNISNYLGDGLWDFEAYGNDADRVVTSYKLDSIYGL